MVAHEAVDVVVIGAGVSGASIALRLAQAGHEVVLVDEKSPGAGASGSCDKAIFLQSKRPGIHMRMAVESRAMYDTLTEELGEDIEFAPHGGMVVIETAAQLEFMRGFVQQQREAGIEVELLDAQQTRARQPELADHVVGSSYSPVDAEVNPLALNLALVRAAERYGAKVLRQTKVTGVESAAGRLTAVRTDAGLIRTNFAVNATGPFAGELGRLVDVATPVVPRRGTILLSDSAEKFIHGNLLCAQYVAAKHLKDIDGASGPRFGVGLSLGQSASGTLLIGGSREFAGFNKLPDRRVLAEIATHAMRIVPRLAHKRIIRAMTGFRPSTGDGLPIIDMDHRLFGWITAAGHEGDGIALAPLTGRLVADLLDGGETFAHYLGHLGAARFQNQSVVQGAQ